MKIAEESIIESQGKTMEVITFKQLIEELVGASFEEVFPGFNKGELSEENNME